MLQETTTRRCVVGRVFTTLPHDYETRRRCKDGSDAYENTMLRPVQQRRTEKHNCSTPTTSHRGRQLHERCPVTLDANFPKAAPVLFTRLRQSLRPRLHTCNGTE